MRKNERKENGRRDTSLKKELVYLLIFALVLGSFGFDWTSVRRAVGIGGNLGADELYIVEAKEFEDEDFLDDEDEFYDDDDDFDYEDEDDFEYDEEYEDDDDFEYEEDYDDDEDFDDDDYDDIDDEDFDDEDDWDEDDEDDWDDEDDVDDEDADSEDAYDEMPAGTLYQKSENGVRVRADFDEDVFPVGAYMELTDISRGEALEAANGAVDNAVDAAGVDISFFDEDGEELEPEDDGDVRVILSLDTPLAKGSGQTVVHVNDDGGATELSDEEVIASSYKSVVFTASEFSLYLVVSTNEAGVAADLVTPSTVSTTTPSTTPSSTRTVVFTAEPITMVAGSQKTLKVGLKSGTDDFSIVRWGSDASSVVTIINPDSNPCIIRAQKTGTVTITATVKIGEYEYKAEQDIDVVDVSVGVSLDNTLLTLTSGESSTLKATVTVTPETEGVSRDVTWKSSDESVATVDNDGVVVAKTVTGTKTATVTATSVADPSQSASCEVTVNPSDSGDSGSGDSGTGDSAAEITSITLDQTSISLTEGSSQTLTATVSVTPGTVSSSVTWTSSDSNVATVDNGLVSAKSAGTATITATATLTNGASKSATCTVKVTAASSDSTTVAVKDVVLNQSTMSLEKGKTKALLATVLPSNATNQNVNWSSSNTSVALVDQSGRVSAVGVGEAKITATSAADSGISDTCTVTVWTSYQVTASDRRSDKTATIEAVGVSGAEDEDLKLIISDITASDKTKLQNLISSNSLSYSIAPYFFELDLVDENNNKVADDDFGACLVTMKLPSGMSASGDVQAVSIANDGTLDILLSRTGTIGGVANCVQFRTDHFSPFAILYAVKSSSSSSTSSGSGSRSSSSGSSVRYVYVDDDDDDDDDDTTTTSDSYTPDIKQVRWWGTDKSTFYWSEKKAVTGYRLQYSTDASFKKAKTKAVNSKKKNVTVTGMKMNKKYYVRVRAYTKSSDGKTTWKSWSHRVIVKRKH